MPPEGRTKLDMVDGSNTLEAPASGIAHPKSARRRSGKAEPKKPTHRRVFRTFFFLPLSHPTARFFLSLRGTPRYSTETGFFLKKHRKGCKSLGEKQVSAKCQEVSLLRGTLCFFFVKYFYCLMYILVLLFFFLFFYFLLKHILSPFTLFSLLTLIS